MSAITPKPLIVGDLDLGPHTTKEAVKATLRARGMNKKEADAAVMVRLVETPNAFHLIDAGPVDAMLAALTRARQWRPSET